MEWLIFLFLFFCNTGIVPCLAESANCMVDPSCGCPAVSKSSCVCTHHHEECFPVAIDALPHVKQALQKAWRKLSQFDPFLPSKPSRKARAKTKYVACFTARGESRTGVFRRNRTRIKCIYRAGVLCVQRYMQLGITRQR